MHNGRCATKRSHNLETFFASIPIILMKAKLSSRMQVGRWRSLQEDQNQGIQGSPAVPRRPWAEDIWRWRPSGRDQVGCYYISAASPAPSTRLSDRPSTGRLKKYLKIQVLAPLGLVSLVQSDVSSWRGFMQPLDPVGLSSSWRRFMRPLFILNSDLQPTSFVQG